MTATTWRAAALALALAAAGPAVPAPPAAAGLRPPDVVSVPGQGEAAFRLAEDYKAFMGVARTQGATVREALRRARAQGFRPWTPGAELAAGSRWYVENRGRALILFVVGRRPVAEGLRVAAAHLDSNYLEFKARPLYEAEGLALVQTNIHGDILNHQWVNTPLALLGRAVRKDGTEVDLSVGLNPGEPVFMVAGLAPQVDADLRERRYRDAILAEELDPIVGLSAGNGSAATAVAAHLKAAYGLDADDLATAEIALVPAMAPRDVGFDRSLMAMYGQDDRFGVFAALEGLFAQRAPGQTAMVFLADNEEVGNRNTGGAASAWLPSLVGELVARQRGAAYRDVDRARALAASKVLSIDVNDAINPTWPSAWEPSNAARIGQGVNLKVYGSGNNATPAYGAWVRRTLDDAGVPWQTATYKVGRATGATLGGELARLNMDVIDLGAPVLSIHNTYEISAKIDLWRLRRAVEAFFSAP